MHPGVRTNDRPFGFALSLAGGVEEARPEIMPDAAGPFNRDRQDVLVPLFVLGDGLVLFRGRVEKSHIDAAVRAGASKGQLARGKKLIIERERSHLVGVGTKGPGSREGGLAMAFKLARKAESRWRKLNGSEKLKDLIDGIVYVDGNRIAA